MASRIIDAIGQPSLGDDFPCAGDGVRLELDADELERRKALRHGHEPAATAAMDIDDASTARQVRDELGSAASTSWKKTAMS